jgi:hypothetical protein
MDASEFSANYGHFADEELLLLWAGRDTLEPQAVMALDGELQRRGLNKQHATRIKKRLDTLAAREAKGPLETQVATVKYERNMRRFVGWEEPEFYSRYGRGSILSVPAHIRHKCRVWKAFREHTGHWPVFSIWFHFLSYLAVFGFAVGAFIWVVESRNQKVGWIVVATIVCVLALLGARDVGVRWMRKIDWRRYGTN